MYCCSRIPPLAPHPTSQTLFWVASISAICTSPTACVPTQASVVLGSLASFGRLIPNTVVSPHLFLFHFLTVSELLGIGLLAILEPKGFLACLLCMVCGLKWSNFCWNWAWKLQCKPENLFSLSTLMGANSNYLKVCFFIGMSQHVCGCVCVCLSFSSYMKSALFGGLALNYLLKLFMYWSEFSHFPRCNKPSAKVTSMPHNYSAFRQGRVQYFYFSQYSPILIPLLRAVFSFQAKSHIYTVLYYNKSYTGIL